MHVHNFEPENYKSFRILMIRIRARGSSVPKFTPYRTIRIVRRLKFDLCFVAI